MGPIVSVIIPCFNHGEFLRETLESLASIRYENIEIIIVNDGSTDEDTLRVLSEVSKEGYRVLQQENQGVGAARNAGIRASAGKYFIPLDADNKIREPYFQDGVALLEQDESIGVVYGDIQCFGDWSPLWKNKSLDLIDFLFENQIDVGALVRRKVWDDCQFSQDKSLNAYADWLFWLNAIKNGWKFSYLDKVVLDYRFLRNSMMRSDSRVTKRTVSIYTKIYQVQESTALAALNRQELSEDEFKKIKSRNLSRLSFYNMSAGDIPTAFRLVGKVISSGCYIDNSIRVVTVTFLKRIFSFQKTA